MVQSGDTVSWQTIIRQSMKKFKISLTRMVMAKPTYGFQESPDINDTDGDGDKMADFPANP